MKAKVLVLLVLSVLMVFAGMWVAGQGVTPTPRPLREGFPVEPFYFDRAIKGDAVSTVLSPQGDMLFVSVLDREKGLQIYRIPVGRVP